MRRKAARKAERREREREGARKRRKYRTLELPVSFPFRSSDHAKRDAIAYARAPRNDRKKKKISRSHEISSRHVYAFIVPVHCSGIPPRFSSPTVYRFPGVLFPAGGGGSKETPFVYLPRRNLSKLPPPPPPLIPRRGRSFSATAVRGIISSASRLQIYSSWGRSAIGVGLGWVIDGNGTG